MTPLKAKKISKFLSYILRHNPDAIGLKLETNGWANLEQLLQLAEKAGRNITLEQISWVVQNNDKQRFKISSDGQKIKANQGHSIPVDLELEAIEPPAILYHGTVGSVLEAIKESGLLPMRRHHVHLSRDKKTATIVGQRRGKPIILQIDAAAMHADGFTFFCSENGVWLVDAVPPKYIQWHAD